MTNREKLIDLLTEDANGETFDEMRYRIRFSPIGLTCLGECAPDKQCDYCYSVWLNEEAKK